MLFVADECKHVKLRSSDRVVVVWRVGGWVVHWFSVSGLVLLVDSAVDSDRLAVDPVAGGAGEERDNRGDIARSPEPLQRSGVGQTLE